MSYRLAFLATTLAVLSSCCFQSAADGPPDAGVAPGDGGNPIDGGNPGDGGATCLRDSDCDSNAYCDLSLTHCTSDPSDYIRTAPGTCHRNCGELGSGCVCQDAADCPIGGGCLNGQCVGGAECGNPAPCSADCPGAAFLEKPCSICLCTACPAPDAGDPTDGGVPCTLDSQCGANAYCDVPLTQCQGSLSLATAAPGSCHRSCWKGSVCVCQDDADCPGGACNHGACMGLGGDCALSGCPPACPTANYAEDPCPFCLCTACPNPDAGSLADSGYCLPDGTASHESSACCSQLLNCCSGCICTSQPVGCP